MQNPNSPPDLLIKLFNKYPYEVLNNPVLELILLEMPDFLERLRQERSSFFWGQFLPDRLFELTPYFSDNLRQYIAQNSSTPASYLAKLAFAPQISVRFWKN